MIRCMLRVALRAKQVQAAGPGMALTQQLHPCIRHAVPELWALGLGTDVRFGLLF